MESSRLAKSAFVVANHPLFDALCEAARIGEMKRIKHLVEVENVPVNARGSFDTFPLYNASLCGHYEVCQYLLQNGAICSEETYEGERSLYAALNDSIRSLLKSYNFSKAQSQDTAYLIFLSNLFTNTMKRSDLQQAITSSDAPCFPDIRFLISQNDSDISTSFHAHRFILIARSAYFASQCLTRWRDIDTIPIKHRRVNDTCFRGTLLWLYTGQIQTDIHEELLTEWLFMAKQWKLNALVEKLTMLHEVRMGTDDHHSSSKQHHHHVSKSGRKKMLDAIQRISQSDVLSLRRDYFFIFRLLMNEKVREHYKHVASGELNDDIDNDVNAEELELLGNGFHDMVLQSVAQFLKEPTSCELAQAMKSYALQLFQKDYAISSEALSNNMHSSQSIERMNLLALKLTQTMRPSIVVKVKTTYFPCHREFLLRSDYFAAMIDFAECSSLGMGGEETASENTKRPLLLELKTIDNPAIVERIIEFVYTDRCLFMTPDIAYELLVISDEFLLPKFKPLIVQFLGTLPRLHDQSKNLSVYEFLRLTFQMDGLSKLEQLCTEYFAAHLSEFIYENGENSIDGFSNEFISLVHESSSNIKNRQETDTIIFIDELRYYIAKQYNMLELIDSSIKVEKQPTKEDVETYWRAMEALDEVLEIVGVEA